MRRLLAASSTFALLAIGAGSVPSAETPPSTLLGLPPQADVDSSTRINLGRKLFMDRRLSRNRTMSCGMCHVPEEGFASNQTDTAIGLGGRHLRRNAPTLLNVGYQSSLFHDGREVSLERQVWSPLLAEDEMDNGSRAELVARLAALADYREPFRRAFPGQRIGEDLIAAALAAYERSLASGNSRFDRWRFGRDSEALSAMERRGLELFTGKGGCAVCHLIGDNEALFTDRRYHNTGIGWQRANRPAQHYTVPLAPGVTTEIAASALSELLGPQSKDEGRFEVSGRPDDRWAYKTPSLRNVALTAPYMHDGSLPTLADVIDFYDRGGTDNPGRDRLLRPLNLSAEDKAALEAFLLALTGDNVKELATEARSAFHTTGAR